MKLTSGVFKKQRLKLGLSQEEIGKRAGVTRQTILGLEKSRFKKLADIINAYDLELCEKDNYSIEDLKSMLQDEIKEKLGIDCSINIDIIIRDDKK